MKEKLLHLIDAGRARESEALVPLVDDSEPREPGRWTAKDNLAHLNAWREVAIAEFDSVLRGTPPPELAEEDDTQNATFYAATKDLAAKHVVEMAATSWRELAGRVAESTDEQLVSPRPGHGGQQLWQAVIGNGFGHLSDHLGYWYLEAADDGRAEEAAVWAHDLTVQIPSDAARAGADYNLGCFYARRGRLTEALPYLRSGVEFDAELRDWAKTDPDLDPIRGEPEVAALLQG